MAVSQTWNVVSALLALDIWLNIVALWLCAHIYCICFSSPLVGFYLLWQDLVNVSKFKLTLYELNLYWKKPLYIQSQVTSHFLINRTCAATADAAVHFSAWMNSCDMCVYMIVMKHSVLLQHALITCKCHSCIITCSSYSCLVYFGKMEHISSHTGARTYC